MTKLHDAPLLPQTIVNALNRYGPEPCLQIDGKVATYDDVRQRASQLQQAQRQSGIDSGTRIAVLSKNRPELILNLIATLINGCVITPLHPLGSFEDHLYALDDADIDVLIFDPTTFEDRATDLHHHRPALILLSLGPTPIGTDLLESARMLAPAPLQAAAVAAEDVAALLYTGGSTGTPKGVLLNQRMFMTMTIIQLTEWEFPDELRMLIVTPLSHAAMSLLVPVLMRGGSFYVMEAFSPDAFYEQVETHRITSTLIVPVILYALQDSPEHGSADMSTMETIFYGASPMNPTRLAAALGAWGQIFYQFYGQTEAPTVIANLRRLDHDLSVPTRLQSCGRPAPWIQVALLDHDNEPVAAGSSGEICVRGPLTSPGYHGQPDKTAELLDGDWLHTGDIGRFDDDGYLYIVARVKDMVITGGFNVFPREVEDVLTRHTAVAAAAVIGVPDEKFGEAVKAVIKLNVGVDPTAELTTNLQEMVKEAKGSVQAPKTIDYVDDIPLTPLGKPDKNAIRQRYWDDQDRAVS